MSQRVPPKTMNILKKDDHAVSNVTGKPLGKSVLRHLFVALGFLCVALGILGIFLPLLPTVPLLLLAAACFARGSERCYAWLIEHRQLGPMLRGYLDGKGIPARAKVTALCLIWMTIPMTVVFAISETWGKALLLSVGLVVSIYLIRLPLRPAEE